MHSKLNTPTKIKILRSTSEFGIKHKSNGRSRGAIGLEAKVIAEHSERSSRQKTDLSTYSDDCPWLSRLMKLYSLKYDT